MEKKSLFQDYIHVCEKQIFNIVAPELKCNTNWLVIEDIISKSFCDLKGNEYPSLEDIANCRATIMNLVEQKLIGHPYWKTIIRKNLLRSFGSRGLEGAMHETIGNGVGYGIWQKKSSKS